MEGRPAEISKDMQSCAVLKDAVVAWQWFVSIAAASGWGAMLTKYGVDAIRTLVGIAAEKNKTGQANWQDVAPLKVFGWLVPVDLKERANVLTMAVAEGMQDKVRELAKKSKSHATKSDKGGKKDGAVSAALQMLT